MTQVTIIAAGKFAPSVPITGELVEWCEGNQAIVRVGRRKYKGRRTYGTAVPASAKQRA